MLCAQKHLPTSIKALLHASDIHVPSQLVHALAVHTLIQLLHAASCYLNYTHAAGFCCMTPLNPSCRAEISSTSGARWQMQSVPAVVAFFSLASLLAYMLQ